MILDVHLLHCDHLPQQHILMHCASVVTKTAAMVREQAVNHVEPFPLCNALVTHAGNDLVQTAPASASAAPVSSDSRGA